MAARWGAGEETLTIGGMELFTAGGPLQCPDLDEDDTCDGLSDLTLSSLDAGGILGTLQGYIDNSIISIIDDPGAQADDLSDPFDEENERSLLNAITEILDNADDENLSPFDTIPDTELLTSPRDKDGSARLLCLSRTPPDHEMYSVDSQRRANANKVDGRCSGPNWELFPDTLNSTPKRRNRYGSVRGCLTRRTEAGEILQRSDGEDEEVPCPENITNKNSSLLALDKTFCVDPEADINDGDEQMLQQGTPCIINTENVAINDLVKYMHDYCLPTITVCLESEEGQNLLSDAVFLEIVSDQGECIKLPVVVETPENMLLSTGDMDIESENLPNHLPLTELGDPEEDMNNDIQVDCTEKSDEVNHEPMEVNYQVLPPLQAASPQPPVADVKPTNDEAPKEVPDQDCKNTEPEITTVPVAKEKIPQKGKKSSKDKQSSKSKSKTKTKSTTEDKSQDAAEPVPVQSLAHTPASRPNNPSLQESDFLTKTLDQVKKESQMELRSSRVGRNKARTRATLETSNPEKKMDRKVKPVNKGDEQAKNTIGADEAAKDVEQNPSHENPKSEETQNSAVDGLQSDKENVSVTSEMSNAEEPSSSEEPGSSKVEDVQDGDSSQPPKEPKPKLLSLSEYRKRFQLRKTLPERDNEKLACSKWPTVPEPPTELAELPCLIVPTPSNKPSIDKKACPPIKASSVPGQDVSASSAAVPATVTPAPVASQDSLNEKPCAAVLDVAPPQMMTHPPTMPPPFYPPAWPVVPPSFYPGMPSLPAVSHYPSGIPPILPVQPPPVMSWPPFPPPPIAVPPVHPTGWVAGPPYWPNAQMAPGMPEALPEQSVPFNATNIHAQSDQKIPQETVVPPVDSRPLTAPPINKTPVLKSENMALKTAPKPEIIKHDKKLATAPKSDVSDMAVKAAMKSKTAPFADAKAANVPIPDLKSANQVVLKIMEILKKAHKLGFQVKPASASAVANTQLGIQVPPSTAASTSVQPKQAVLPNVKVQMVDKVPTQEVHVSKADDSSLVEKVPTSGNVPAPEVVEVKPSAAWVVKKQEDKGPVLPPSAETLCASAESFQMMAESDQKETEKSLTCESGIEASDLTSLLEQFEQSEAKEEERLPQCPDRLAVGNSGTGKTLEKKIHDKLLAPELVNTAGLTPPATPPHQLWKSVVPGPVTGKSKSLHGQEKTCSPPKTTKLIEPKPLPQSRLKNRNLASTPAVVLPPIHVASGDHDYCILSSQRTENKPVPTSAPPAAPAQCEEGSRWNVKHHQNITIKPIVQFNKRPQNKACPKQSAPSAPSVVPNQSTISGPATPVAPCDSNHNASSNPLDHRTNVMAESAVTDPPDSVLMSPDSSPCRSENEQSRTDLKNESSSTSRRALRCYRKYKRSPSPQKSSWRGRSSGSRSDSRSSSSSRSRSGSPASKRRRTSRYRSRSRCRSRSSSRSSYASSCSSRSSSYSSRSYSPSSSRSRSRSRSPYRRRYRSRSRRCESRESYNRRRMYHKERAIEERRVVYIGKINSQMTRSELKERFSVFGEIEECTIHFREEGDNYGFVTYRCTREAFAAIENGHKLRLPDELPFDLCFGGRRQFCKSNYADLDSNRDDFDPAPVRSKFESLDFDTLLKQAQKSHRR
ncbi:peroxisome proliferator-activated receptor gamma coactivator-related protein 1 [Leptodactylus fuscus]|uniref:peroxisome proliferator-activated receptor gamma coactivator-related protein 1 n=1 Tax=Leptodactylus fuscus TaxID=238119 RepID=UPI003F4F028F